MADIQIKKMNEDGGSSKFLVSVDDGKGESEHSVTLQKSYFDLLTNESGTPEKLIEAAFGFLLTHEPKESILSEFDVSLIQNYFPKFEEEMQRMFRV